MIKIMNELIDKEMKRGKDAVEGGMREGRK